MKLESFDSLKENVLMWANDRDLLDERRPIEGQILKFEEEADEMAVAARQLAHRPGPDSLTSFKDGVGDTLVTIIITCERFGVDPVDCLSYAYGEIRNRTGHVNEQGMFVKDDE